MPARGENYRRVEIVLNADNDRDRAVWAALDDMIAQGESASDFIKQVLYMAVTGEVYLADQTSAILERLDRLEAALESNLRDELDALRGTLRYAGPVQESAQTNGDDPRHSRIDQRLRNMSFKGLSNE